MKLKNCLLVLLVTVLVSCSTVSAPRDIYTYKVGRIKPYGIIGSFWEVNFVNLQTSCGIYSVTVAHFSPYIEIIPLKSDEVSDIAIYPQLDSSPIYPLSSAPPQIGEELIIVSQWYKQYVYFKVRVAAIVDIDGKPYIAVDGPGYPGMSGSPAFNLSGEFVGSMSQGHIGFGYSGLSFLTYTPTIKRMQEELCPTR